MPFQGILFRLQPFHFLIVERVKNILFLTHKFWPTVGGTQTLSQNLGKRLVERGYRVTIFTSMVGSECQEEWFEGMHIRRFRRQGIGINRPWYVTPGMILTTNLREFDLIHAFHFVTFQCLFAASIRKVLRTPLIMTASYHPWDGWYEKTVAPLVVRSADRVIAQCESERIQLSTFVSSSKLVKIPCGIERKRFSLMPGGVEFKRASEIAENEKVVLYVGSLSNEKGLGDLLTAMVRVLESVETAVLLVIGGGSRDTFLSKAKALGISSHVRFFGRASDSEVVKAYSIADVFVLPSHTESFGIALVEAAAAGVPIVSTQVGVASEIVREGYNGFNVDPQSDRLAQRIIDVLSSDSMKANAERQRKLVIETFDWDVITNSVVDVYGKYLRR